jgi:hypothetical protein
MRFLEIHRMISQNLPKSQTIAFDSDGRIGIDTYQCGLLAWLDAGCFRPMLLCGVIHPGL